MSVATTDLPRVGVLLINLGTPDATDYWSMRRYLKEFLSDPRVIEVNRLIWWPLLNGIILSIRPQKSGRNYDKIWNHELNESPLRTFTREQSEKLQEALDPNGHSVQVDWAMRYGTPSIREKLDRLTRSGCERILLFPLYPQYSASTSATAIDKAFDALMEMRHEPAIRIVPPYYNHPAHITALANSIAGAINDLDWKPELILASFHGLPKSYSDRGDPYPDHCVQTVRQLENSPILEGTPLMMAYQSRVGRAEWLQPYTDRTIAELARKGLKRLAVVTPGFASDCIETLEEIAMGGAEIFMKNGGEKFTAIPCLNASSGAVSMLSKIVCEELQGWITTGIKDRANSL